MCIPPARSAARAVFRLLREIAAATICRAQHGHERRLRDGDPLGATLGPRRHRDFRRARITSAVVLEAAAKRPSNDGRNTGRRPSRLAARAPQGDGSFIKYRSSFAFQPASEAPTRRPPAPRNPGGRGRSSVARHVNENRAAPSGNPRPRIVVDLDDQVIKRSSRHRRSPAALSVSRSGGYSAGREGPRTSRRRRNRPHRQAGARPWAPVRAPPQPDGPENPARSTAVAFPLVRPDAATSERDGKAQRSRRQPALCPPAGASPHIDPLEALLHSASSLAGLSDVNVRTCRAIGEAGERLLSAAKALVIYPAIGGFPPATPC